jgi:para-aminobenzoate synthetase component 1
MYTILSEDIAYTANSEPLFDRLRDLPDAIWLDSGKPRSLQGRFDIISACPASMIETYGDCSTISSEGEKTETTADPFAIAKQLLDQISPINSPEEVPFVSGLIGYFSYDLGQHITSIPSTVKSAVNMPDMRIGLYLWSLVVDHKLRKSTLFFHHNCTQSLREIVRYRLMHCQDNQPVNNEIFKLEEKFNTTVDKQHYKQHIERVKNYIAAGDCYQVNYTQHLSAPYKGSLWQAYLSLRKASPAPYSVFWQWQEQALLCLSPERFIQTSVEADQIQAQTKPIKGTVLRGSSVEEDQENAIRLINSNKDRAENLMIVDLLRNDFGKSCIAGSVKVPKLFDLESFPNVHHLVSTVTGTVRADRSPVDLLNGCFPGGSITGAPKKRAMQIIEELEPVKRSVYCGSIGYICASNKMDTNIAIRTVLADDSTLHCWGGGGIVADSDADCEYEESMNKIRLLLETLEAI